MNLELKSSAKDLFFIDPNLPKIIPSSALFGKEKSIVINHDGQRYVLRITKLRKLILTK
ncbi:hemin uptake protein HemP [Polynucleobacter sp. AM-25C3]|jgi:hemin uptake protein HemP|uniref:hemin uptake protein HemP n=1 Tax=Polynucleobacter sp. AM-25C3 TaxID=1855569 RepID=UPI001C0C86DF|nr:hemin uptake protein HemP [Polynucleobacter sp. AM-25C3]